MTFDNLIGLQKSCSEAQLVYRTATRPSTEFEGRAPPDYTQTWGRHIFLSREYFAENADPSLYVIGVDYPCFQSRLRVYNIYGVAGQEVKKQRGSKINLLPLQAIISIQAGQKRHKVTTEVHCNVTTEILSAKKSIFDHIFVYF